MSFVDSIPSIWAYLPLLRRSLEWNWSCGEEYKRGEVCHCWALPSSSYTQSRNSRDSQVMPSLPGDSILAPWRSSPAWDLWKNESIRKWEERGGSRWQNRRMWSSHPLTNTSKIHLQDFPGGSGVKNPPANAGDTCSSPGPGRSHMPRSN